MDGICEGPKAPPLLPVSRPSSEQTRGEKLKGSVVLSIPTEELPPLPVVRVKDEKSDPLFAFRQQLMMTRAQPVPLTGEVNVDETSPPLLFEECECCICFQLFVDPVTTPCAHTFCMDCLSQSLRIAKACPLCRSPVSEPLRLRRNYPLQSYIRSTFPDEYRTRRATRTICPVHVSSFGIADSDSEDESEFEWFFCSEDDASDNGADGDSP